MGRQYAGAKAIRNKEADCLPAMKGNQSALNEGIREYMDGIDAGQEAATIVNQWDSGCEKAHGRIERRGAPIYACPEWKGVTDEWRDMHTLVRYECTREKRKDTEGKPDAVTKSKYTRCYISSIRAVDAALVAKCPRGHWSIENQPHGMLDVVFREDASSVRMNHAPESLNILRKAATLY